MATSTFKPGVLETEDRICELAFDSSGRYLIAEGLVFEASSPTPTQLPVEWGTLVAHPSKPVIAVVRDDGVDLVELDGKRAATKLKANNASAGAFDSTGNRFVVSCDYSHELLVYSVGGKLERKLAMPDPETSGAAVVFAPDNRSVIAIDDKQNMVTLPLDGSKPTAKKLARSKVLGGRALRLGDRILSYDTANSALFSADGTVAWTSKLGNEAVAVVPGTSAIGYVRMNKGAITFVSANDGKEVASIKVKVKAAPLGFACTRTLAAWAREGAIELVALPKLL